MNLLSRLASSTAVARALAWAGAVLSGVLLALAFAPFEMSQAAWVALVPLLLVILRSTPAQAFRFGFCSGWVAWLVSLAWLLRLWQTSPESPVLLFLAWAALAAYCALFTGAFAFTAAWAGARLGRSTVLRSTALAVLVPVIWVGFEYWRAMLFTGFGWDAVGTSQFRNLPLIQVAAWLGVYGVSFLVVFFSAGVALTLLRFAPAMRSGRYRPHPEFFLPVLAVVAAIHVGLGICRRPQQAADFLTVAAVQPAVAQVQKWTEAEERRILGLLRSLTTQALRATPAPTLIIWPETATPQCVTQEGASRDLVVELASAGVPLLVGSMDGEEREGVWRWWNGVFLFGADGQILDRYDKQHLVPFGEYFPLDGVIPGLRAFAPLGFSCTPGTRATVFRVPGRTVTFSSLICFEDMMPELARRFVLRGARLLVNQTNDAWFDRSPEPMQHLSHSVFRAVENRVPVVRVANSGVTCWIDQAGGVHDATRNSLRDAPSPAVRLWTVPLPATERPLTFYTRLGDLSFALPCGTAAAVLCLVALVQQRSARLIGRARAAEA